MLRYILSFLLMKEDILQVADDINFEEILVLLMQVCVEVII